MMSLVRCKSFTRSKPLVPFWRPEFCLSWCSPTPILTFTSCFRLRRVRRRNWQLRRACLQTFLLLLRLQLPLLLRLQLPHRYLIAIAHSFPINDCTHLTSMAVQANTQACAPPCRKPLLPPAQCLTTRLPLR